MKTSRYTFCKLRVATFLSLKPIKIYCFVRERLSPSSLCKVSKNAQMLLLCSSQSPQITTGSNSLVTSKCALPTSPCALDRKEFVSSSYGQPSQPESSVDRRSHKRVRRNSPPLTSSPPLTQPAQPNSPTATQPEEPGWHPTVKESRQEKIRRVRKEASDLQDQFVTVVSLTESYLTKRHSTCKDFLADFCISLKNLPLSKKFKHMKFLKEERGKIEKAHSVSEIFSLLEDYWDFTDFSLLLRIIELFGNDDMKVMMEEYM